MHGNVERQMLAAMPSGTLRVGARSWRLYVLEARLIGRDWFMKIAAVGMRTHTIDVRTRADRGHSATAERVLGAVHDWLVSDDPSDDVFLELAGISDLPC